MSKEALAYLKSNFERELWDLRIDDASRMNLKAMPQTDRLEQFKQLIRKDLLSFILLENLSVDVDSILDEKLEYVCGDNYRPDVKPSKPLLEQLFEGMEKPQLLCRNKDNLTHTSEIEHIKDSPQATQTTLTGGKVQNQPESLLR